MNQKIDDLSDGLRFHFSWVGKVIKELRRNPGGLYVLVELLLGILLACIMGKKKKSNENSFCFLDLGGWDETGLEIGDGDKGAGTSKFLSVS